ncbi:MAG TPA: hypothetical protein VFT95_09875 [Micromonosporaceae bacterium]|nr:hypothetical protein [Micromonosporaceae bacterium]
MTGGVAGGVSDVRPVPADAVHVWRGYRGAAVSPKAFVDFLSTVFVPACALLQPAAGLHAYLPALPAAPVTGVPDQTALMFWTDQQAYRDAFATPAVRAYTNLHGDLYGPPSSAEFPVPFAGDLVAEQPYHLLTAPADWMLGGVHHVLGGRPTGTAPADFRAGLARWARTYQTDLPSGVDGALLVAGDGYAAFWQHGPGPAVDPPAGLAELLVLALDASAQPLSLPGGLWDRWPGLDLPEGAVVNVALDRPR